MQQECHLRSFTHHKIKMQSLIVLIILWGNTKVEKWHDIKPGGIFGKSVISRPVQMETCRMRVWSDQVLDY